MKNPKLISGCMKGIVDELDPRKELFDLINFDGSKVVKVAGELLQVYRTKTTYRLCTLSGGNT